MYLEIMKTVSDKTKEDTKTKGGSGQPQPKPGGVATPDTKRGIGSFFGDVQREMKKVSWPTPNETTRLTSTVIGVCLLVAAVLFVFSFTIEKFFDLILLGGS